MSTPERGPLAVRVDRVYLLVDVGTCLAAWHRAVAERKRPGDPAMAGLRRLSDELRWRLPAVGFGGIAYHLGELIRRFDAGGSAGDLREPFEALVHLAEQARISLSAQEHALLARTGSNSSAELPDAPALVAPTAPPTTDIAPPRVLSDSGPQPMMLPTALDSEGPCRGPVPNSPRDPQVPTNPQASLPLAGSKPSQPAPRLSIGAAHVVLGPGPKVPLGPQDSGGLARQSSRSQSGETNGSLLGLRRRASSVGLLGGGEVPAPRPSERTGLARNVRDLLSGLQRPRDGPRRSSEPGRPAPLDHRQKSQQGSLQPKIQHRRVIAIAAALLVLVLGGVSVLVVAITRRADRAGGSRALSIAASHSSGRTPTTSGSGELPQARLLEENESFRALIAQVHGRGKESAQLRALLDEQAALAARSLSSKQCDGPPAACQTWANLRESALGRVGARRIARRRAAGSPDRVRSRWMVGLTLPEIPVEDDPRVQRAFEYYTENPVGRETFQAMLFRCGAYRDLIQSTLIRYGLPADLLAMVFVESGCEPQAISPIGAAGLWQFMPATGRAYDMRVTESVDERFSPPKSTDAAVRLLRDLRDKLVVYGSHGVWDLVLASYNLGPFAMVARIEQAGGDVGFWDLVGSDVLPDETAQYAPNIQAVALILNNLQRLKFTGIQMRMPQLTSDLRVPAGTRLSLIARAASTSLNQLRSLNLDIRGQTTPAVPDFAVQVSKDVVWQARDTVQELLARHDESDRCVAPDFDWGRQQFTKEMAAACQRKLRTNPNPTLR